MSDHYGLIPARNFTIPLEAEGIMSDDADYDETNESIGEQLLPVALDPEIGEVNDTLPASGTDATPATSKSVSQSKAKEGPLPGVEEEDEEQEEEHKEGEDGGHDDGEEQSGQDELGEPPAPVTKRHVSPTRKQPARSLDIEGPSQKAADQEKDEGQEILVSMELDEEVPGESVKKQLPEKEVELVAEPEGIESSAEVPKLQGKETVEAAEEKKA